nr:hypothetical protein CFP56_38754 [Quercus suber]
MRTYIQKLRAPSTLLKTHQEATAFAKLSSKDRSRHMLVPPKWKSLQLSSHAGVKKVTKLHYQSECRHYSSEYGSRNRWFGCYTVGASRLTGMSERSAATTIVAYVGNDAPWRLPITIMAESPHHQAQKCLASPLVSESSSINQTKSGHANDTRRVSDGSGCLECEP